MSNPYQAQIDFLSQQIDQNQQLLNDPELAELAQLEIENLNQQKQMLVSAAQDFESGVSGQEETLDNNFRNCTIEIRPGTGGDEAKIWATDLLRMYLRFIEIVGLKVEYLDDLVIKVKGELKAPDEFLTIDDENELNFPPASLTAYQLFKYESGVHRVQRVPVTESQGRIHTSTASVAVLPEVPKTAVEIRPEELEWQFYRAGGAGGQNVNKVNTAVRLSHLPTNTVVTCSSERTQVRNREIALDLLRSQLWDIQEEERLKKIGKARSVIGRAMRAEKIRTFNYPQNRVTDHRINQSWYNLENIVEGNLGHVMGTVFYQLEKQEAAEELAKSA